MTIEIEMRIIVLNDYYTLVNKTHLKGRFTRFENPNFPLYTYY